MCHGFETISLFTFKSYRHHPSMQLFVSGYTLIRETKKKSITCVFLCFQGPRGPRGAIPGEGRPAISDELTSGKPSKRQTSIRPPAAAAAILGVVYRSRRSNGETNVLTQFETNSSRGIAFPVRQKVIYFKVTSNCFLPRSVIDDLYFRREGTFFRTNGN